MSVWSSAVFLYCCFACHGSFFMIIYTAGELKMYRSFNVNISAPGCARNLKLLALDLSGPQVVEIKISASYIKN
jgi:hypothetical protein